jgi:hypothetical protein
VRHLLHESQADLRLAHNLAVIRFESASNDSKKRCLPSTVATYESNFFVGIQLEAGVLEDCFASEALTDVIEMNKHGKAGWPVRLASASKKGQPELPFEKLFRERVRA